MLETSIHQWAARVGHGEEYLDNIFLTTAFLFTLAAMLATRRKRQNVIANAAVWVCAGIAQVSMMWFVIRMVEPNDVF